MKLKLPGIRIPPQFYIIPLILVLCIILALVIGGGVMKWVFVTLGSIIGGLGVAGFVTLALNEEKSPRLFGMGIAMMVPVLLVLTLFFGWGWLMTFLPYTGILTVIMLILDAWRRRANPQPPVKKK
jgi:hypothetical protein